LGFVARFSWIFLKQIHTKAFVEKIPGASITPQKTNNARKTASERPPNPKQTFSYLVSQQRTKKKNHEKSKWKMWKIFPSQLFILRTKWMDTKKYK
jgi:hypothetical protein